MTEFNLPNYLNSFCSNLASLDLPEVINYLEIGVCEGRSALHMFENYLGVGSTYTGVEIDPRPNMFSNLAQYQTSLLIGDSKDILPKLRYNQFDLIYIDGNHSTEYVTHDTLFSFNLIKPGGIIIWDDYDTTEFGVTKAVDDCLKDKPHTLLFKNWQVGVKLTKR